MILFSFDNEQLLNYQNQSFLFRDPFGARTFEDVGHSEKPLSSPLRILLGSLSASSVPSSLTYPFTCSKHFLMFSSLTSLFFVSASGTLNCYWESSLSKLKTPHLKGFLLVFRQNGVWFWPLLHNYCEFYVLVQGWLRNLVNFGGVSQTYVVFIDSLYSFL